MHRLLKRQIKRYFGEEFEDSLNRESFSKFIEEISNSYDELYAEKKFLEHTIDINSQDIEKANIKIREQNSHLQRLLDKRSDENEETVYMLNQYKEAIDTSLIVSTTDLSGRIKYINSNFSKISGYSAAELLGKSHNIVRHPDVPKSVFKEMWDTILNKKVWQGVFPNRAKNGTIYYVNATIVPLLNRDGNIVEFMALREDVTKAIEYQNRLESEKQRVSQILDNQESIIVLFDKISGVTEANKKFFEVFGFATLEKFQEEHQCVCELFEVKDNFLKPSNDAFFWVTPIVEEPQKVHLALINKRVYSVKIAIVEIDDKKTYLATFTDITEIEEARIKSHEAEKEKSNFLANMSHEIRTPMNAILGFSELLSKTKLEARQSKFVDLIKSSSATLIQIINDILDFSKLESGQTELDTMKINPFMEFEDTFLLLAGRAAEKNLSYMIEIDPLLEECIELDSFYIKQILMNLIGNAIKFTPEHGTVDIKIKKQLINGNKSVRFLVQDSGIGIPEDRQQKIFEPFSQADSSTTRKFGGTGLGLSISNSLVAMMGSRLQLESKEGAGSKFYFDLAYEHCVTNNTLKEHLGGLKIYLFDMDEISLRSAAEQLNAYKIEHQILETFDEKIDLDNSIILSTNEESTKSFQYAKILLLLKTDDSFEDLRHHQVEIFHDFPSILYNELMRLKLIKTDMQASNDAHSVHLKILVAEDYEVNRILIAELLDQFDIEYSFATNGLEAVEMVKNSSYDLILMDINMPIMNGMDATKIIINDLKVTTPIVALTANALDGDRDKFLSIGMHDYLSKPIDIRAFEALLVKQSQAVQTNGGNNKSVITQNRSLSSQTKGFLDINLSLESAAKNMNFPQAIIGKLVKSYVSSLNELENNIEDGIAQKDFPKIQINAHNIKSGAASLCFDVIAKLAQELETNSRDKKEDFDFLKKLEEIKPYIKSLLEYQSALDL
ncbi:MAG: ATP-binding protein [Campylobacterales bacterium]|nr:ATP-binding protein [Campylobacterales bacterium]